MKEAMSGGTGTIDGTGTIEQLPERRNSTLVEKHRKVEMVIFQLILKYQSTTSHTKFRDWKYYGRKKYRVPEMVI